MAAVTQTRVRVKGYAVLGGQVKVASIIVCHLPSLARRGSFVVTFLQVVISLGTSLEPPAATSLPFRFYFSASTTPPWPCPL